VRKAITSLAALLCPLSLLNAEVSRQSTLSPAEVARAIDAGMAAEPEPYQLRSVFPGKDRPAAVVYTPSVRIGLIAATSRRSGRTSTPRDIDQDTASPLLQVVMNAIGPHRRVTENDPILMEVLQRPDPLLLGSSTARKPVWIAHEPGRIERLLEPPDAGLGVVIGAFEREHLCGGCYVATYRRHQESGRLAALMSLAVIGDDAPKTWR
jgi:hypothetical protein